MTHPDSVLDIDLEGDAGAGLVIELTLLGTIVTGLTTLDRSLPVNKEAAGGDYATAG